MVSKWWWWWAQRPQYSVFPFRFQADFGLMVMGGPSRHQKYGFMIPFFV